MYVYVCHFKPSWPQRVCITQCWFLRNPVKRSQVLLCCTCAGAVQLVLMSESISVKNQRHAPSVTVYVTVCVTSFRGFQGFLHLVVAPAAPGACQGWSWISLEARCHQRPPFIIPVLPCVEDSWGALWWKLSTEHCAPRSGLSAKQPSVATYACAHSAEAEKFG
jgi:hypothetical protein